jgi:hypothetical protein
LETLLLNKDKHLERSGKTWIILFVVLYLVGFLVSVYFPALRYYKYALPPVAFVLLVITHFSSWYKQTLKEPITLLLITLVPVVFSLGWTMLQGDVLSRGLAEAFFILSPLITALCLKAIWRKDYFQGLLLLISFGFILIFILEARQGILSIFQSPNVLLMALITSNIDTETALTSFILCLLALALYFRKSYAVFLITFVFAFLGFKRIAFFSVLIIIALHALFRVLKIDVARNRLLWTGILVGANALFLFFLFSLISGEYDQWIYENTGLTTNALLLGRYDLYHGVVQKLGGIAFLGHGLGKTYTILSNQHSELLNLHSDVLKNFLEFGPLLFFIWITFLAYQFTKNNRHFFIFLFINFLFLTDNVFIYFDVMFIFYMIIFFSLHQKPPSVIHENSSNS